MARILALVGCAIMISFFVQCRGELAFPDGEVWVTCENDLMCIDLHEEARCLRGLCVIGFALDEEPQGEDNPPLEESAIEAAQENATVEEKAQEPLLDSSRESLQDAQDGGEKEASHDHLAHESTQEATSEATQEAVAEGSSEAVSEGSAEIGKEAVPEPPKPLREVRLTVGSFWMGSPTMETGRSPNEVRRYVTLTRSFWIQMYEVTQGEFEAVMGSNPSLFKGCGANCPVERVSWHQAVAYANALSRQAGLVECFNCTGTLANTRCSVKPLYSSTNYYSCPGYRLPTEAEWEFAYRAGTTTAFYNGPNTQSVVDCSIREPRAHLIGWYCGNSDANYNGCSTNNHVTASGRCLGTHPVGQKQPNAWGLYDMAGNVWEWVFDQYNANLSNLAVTNPVGTSGAQRVFRGGAWSAQASGLRAARRAGLEPDQAGATLGFRLVRTDL